MSEDKTLGLLREVLRKTLLEPCDHKRRSHEDVGCVVADIEAAIASAGHDAALRAGLLKATHEAVERLVRMEEMELDGVMPRGADCGDVARSLIRAIARAEGRE